MLHIIKDWGVGVAATVYNLVYLHGLISAVSELYSSLEKDVLIDRFMCLICVILSIRLKE